MKWVKCSERLPEIKKSVLIFSPAYNVIDITWLTSEGKFLFAADYEEPDYYEKDEVTHWAEIEPPK